MFEKALFFEIVIAIAIFVIYKLFTFSTSDAKKRDRIQKQIKLEQEKENQREVLIQEKIQKNIHRFKELASISVLKKEKNVLGYLNNMDITKELRYDYETKELTLEEQKKYYEEHMEKLKDIRIQYGMYIPHLPFALLRFYKWYSYSTDFATFLIEEFKSKGLDIIPHIPKIFDDAVNYQNEYSKAKKNTEKKYQHVCRTIEKRKLVNKELERLKKDITKLSSVKYMIDESMSVTFDNIVITENGIFCIYIKYLDKPNIEKVYIGEDEKWTGELENGEKYYIEPIDGQFFKNIQRFQKLVNEKLKAKYNDSTIPYLMIYPIVIVTEDNLIIENESTVPIKKLSNLFNHIQLFKGSKISIDYLRDLKEIMTQLNIGQKTDMIDDNTKLLEENGKLLSNLLKVLDMVHECTNDYCILIEERNIIRAYRQYIAFEHFLKYKKSAEDANIIHFGYSNKIDEKYRNTIQDPSDPLITRLIEPCITTPMKILAKLLDLSMLKIEYILNDMYSTNDLKKVPAISYQYINRAMVEIISSNVSEEVLNSYMQVESYNNLKLYKIQYFDPN